MSDAPWAATRDELVRAAVSRDPGITARARRVRALAETARSEGSLPPPELAAQVWNLPASQPWSVGDADMYMLELRQRFPAPGSLDARARATVSEAAAALTELSARERELAMRVSVAWADHMAGALHHRVHDEHLAVVEQMLSAARARLSSGRGGLDDTVRVELERARVLRQLARFDNDRRRAARVLNALLQREPDAPLDLPIEARGETVDIELPSLLARAMARRSSVMAARARVEATRGGVDAARAEAAWPEFTVGLSGWFDPNHHNGFGANVGMTLPWLWGPGSARTSAARERLAAGQSELRELELGARVDVVESASRVEGIERELALVRGDSRVATERALESARNGYVTGAASLLMWLDAARMRLDLAMDDTDLVVELARAVAALEQAVGEALARVPLRADMGGAS